MAAILYGVAILFDILCIPEAGRSNFQTKILKPQLHPCSSLWENLLPHTNTWYIKCIHIHTQPAGQSFRAYTQ